MAQIYGYFLNKTNFDDIYLKIYIMVRKKQSNFYKVHVIPADQVQTTLVMGDDGVIEPSVNQIVDGAIPF